MKKVAIFIFCVLIFFSGCKMVKAIGEAVGIGGDKKEQTTKTTKIVDKDGKVIIKPTPSKVPITSKTMQNLLLYCAITLVVLFGVRFGVKKLTKKDK
jgi:hypothetical protein